MINWNVNPELLNIWVFSIRYYGIIYALGFIITFFYLNHQRKNLEFSKDQIYDLMLYLILGVILGARIFEVIFWQPSYYFNNPSQILAVWNGGLSFHGGLIGALISCYLFSKKNKINLLRLADFLIIPATLAVALGRLGNLFNSEIYGTISNLPWCFNFMNVEGCRHPYQIYSFLTHFLSFFTLLKIKNYKEGFLFWFGLFLFGITRFITDFWREEILYYGLNLGQYFSIPLILISLYFLIKKFKEIN